MAVKTEHVLLGVAGGGFTILGFYLIYSEYQKNKHIAEYLAKAERAENAYRNAIDADNVEEAQDIAQFYESLMRQEEKVIKAEGGAERLVKRLAQLGIIVFVGLISYSIIRYLMKKYPPRNYQPPTTPSQVVPANIPVGESAFRKLSRYLKGLVNSFAEVPEYMTEQTWVGLPRWALLALALAAMLLIALSMGLFGPALAPIAAMAI